MKAAPDDFLGRFREIISDPLNLLIERDSSSGMIDKDEYVCLHNGNKVPVSGKNSYYGEFSKILIVNRGVHEPLEEFCFQETLKKIKDQKILNLDTKVFCNFSNSTLSLEFPCRYESP